MKAEPSDTSKAVLTFVSGLALGVALVKTVKSKFARKAAVAVLAKGMQFKDDAQAAYEVIKEDAQDVVEEAKVKHIASVVAVAEAKAREKSENADAEAGKAVSSGAGAQSAANESAKPKSSPSKASASTGAKRAASASRSGSK